VVGDDVPAHVRDLEHPACTRDRVGEREHDDGVGVGVLHPRVAVQLLQGGELGVRQLRARRA